MNTKNNIKWTQQTGDDWWMAFVLIGNKEKYPKWISVVKEDDGKWHSYVTDADSKQHSPSFFTRKEAMADAEKRVMLLTKV